MLARAIDFSNPLTADIRLGILVISLQRPVEYNSAIAQPKSDRTQKTIRLETKKAILISNSIASSGPKNSTSSIVLKGDRGNFNLKSHISAAFGKLSASC
jgi:hypothetical protein